MFGLSGSRHRFCHALLVAVLTCGVGCGSTTDTLGYTGFQPLTKPSSYPNAFVGIGKTEEDVSRRIEALFQLLFYGSPEDQAIYAEAPDHESAWINDVYHSDVRTEGFGLAMLITVELDKRAEFDKLWAGAQAYRNNDGPAIGYYHSKCDKKDPNQDPSLTDVTRIWPAFTVSPDCDDPFGLELFAMALLLAHNRWGDGGTIHYGIAASDLFHLMRHKQEISPDPSGDVTNMFDDVTKLVYDVPHAKQTVGDDAVLSSTVTRPSLLMPAFYTLWAQATGDAFFADAASRARSYLSQVADTNTAFTPVRATFNGDPVLPYNIFLPESARVQLNLMLDQVWTGANPDAAALANRLLIHFLTKQKKPYVTEFNLDGSRIDTKRTDADGVMDCVNGFSAAIATIASADRNVFVNAVWSLPFPTKEGRYFAGLMQLLSLMALGGRLQVY